MHHSRTALDRSLNIGTNIYAIHTMHWGDYCIPPHNCQSFQAAGMAPTLPQDGSQPRLPFMTRSISRFDSRSFRSWRLSYSFLPRTTPSSTFTWLPLK